MIKEAEERYAQEHCVTLVTSEILPISYPEPCNFTAYTEQKGKGSGRDCTISRTRRVCVITFMCLSFSSLRDEGAKRKERTERSREKDRSYGRDRDRDWHKDRHSNRDSNRDRYKDRDSDGDRDRDRTRDRDRNSADRDRRIDNDRNSADRQRRRDNDRDRDSTDRHRRRDSDRDRYSDREKAKVLDKDWDRGKVSKERQSLFEKEKWQKRPEPESPTASARFLRPSDTAARFVYTQQFPCSWCTVFRLFMCMIKLRYLNSNTKSCYKLKGSPEKVRLKP